MIPDPLLSKLTVLERLGNGERLPIVPDLVDYLYGEIRREVLGLCPVTVKKSIASVLFGERERAEAELTHLRTSLASAEQEREQAKAAVREAVEWMYAFAAETPLPNGEYAHAGICSGSRQKPAGSSGCVCLPKMKARVAAAEASLASAQEALRKIIREPVTDSKWLAKEALSSFGANSREIRHEEHEETTDTRVDLVPDLGHGDLPHRPTR